ncbi:MAG: uracil-DNA glycosylase [Sulfurimonadaceae bacterium]|jgi:uracil-DNA glycosylase|nr:uracil-DNA glycosylase [Sulfurimonadaceae bacterium]
MLLDTDWKDLLAEEFDKEYFLQLQSFVEQEYQEKTVYPKYENIFRAFNLMKPQNVKVIIIGQDPYHGVNQANGLAFSVCDSCPLPPSLKNIYKELATDLGCEISSSGNLIEWAEQGVLLINTILTVREKEPYSHKNRGWEIFTDTLLGRLSQEFEHIVFILWGAPSQKKEKLIDSTKHLIIKSAHPSPLSAYRGFFGSKPFSHANNYLHLNGKESIEWCLNR